MSIRYSGDAEVRLGFDPKKRVYRGTVVDHTRLRWRGEVSVGPSRDPHAPEAYDRAARVMLDRADRWAKKTHGRRFSSESKGGRRVMKRGYQAPCPLE